MSIIVASITLNNFIHMERLGIPIVEHDSNVQGTADSDLFNSQRKLYMNQVRTNIATRICQSIPNDMKTQTQE